MSRIELREGWSLEPDAHVQQYSSPLLRCRPGQNLNVVFLSAQPVGRYLHWDGFRTVPCTGEICMKCQHNVRRDWKMYIPVWSPGSGSIAMLELPYSALKFFKAQIDRSKTVYAHHAEIGRKGDNPKALVVVSFRGTYKGTTPLPEGPCPVKYMERVWGILPSDPTPGKQTGSKTHPGRVVKHANGVVSYHEPL